MSPEMGVAEACRQRTRLSVIAALRPAIDLLQRAGMEVEAFQARYLLTLLEEGLAPDGGRRRPALSGAALQVLEGGWEPDLRDPAGWPA